MKTNTRIAPTTRNDDRLTIDSEMRAGEVGQVASAYRKSNGDTSMSWGTANWGGWAGTHFAMKLYTTR